MAVSLKMITQAIKNNYGQYLAKAAGAAAVGMIGYDAHIYGKLQADTYSQSREADDVGSTFNNTMYLSEPSIVQSNMKKFLFNFEMENNFGDLWNSAVGYLGGAVSMLTSAVVPLGLGLTALLAKNKTLSKGAGIGLVGVGAIKFVRDIMGLNQNDPLNPTFK